MSSSLRFAVVLVLIGCSGSAGDIALKDPFVGGNDAATIDGSATDASNVGAPDASHDAEPPPSTDAGEPEADASDAGVVDTGVPPVVDSGPDVDAPPDASNPVDASAPVDAAPPVDSGPVDSGPVCVQTPDKTACKYFGSGATGMYSTGIADDGCGSYYNCHAATCGARSNGPNDAGLAPTGPVSCLAGTVPGWEYSCLTAPDLIPAECVSISTTTALYCCPIPKDGQPFSKVIF